MLQLCVCKSLASAMVSARGHGNWQRECQRIKNSLKKMGIFSVTWRNDDMHKSTVCKHYSLGDLIWIALEQVTVTHPQNYNHPSTWLKIGMDSPVLHDISTTWPPPPPPTSNFIRQAKGILLLTYFTWDMFRALLKLGLQVYFQCCLSAYIQLNLSFCR